MAASLLVMQFVVLPILQKKTTPKSLLQVPRRALSWLLAGLSA